MKKGKLILYIVLIAILAGAFTLVLCSKYFAAPQEAYAAETEKERNPGQVLPSYPEYIEKNYKVNTPIEGYDYYLVLQTDSLYNVYFFNTVQTDNYLKMYNGKIPTYNMYSDGGAGPATQTITTTFGGTWDIVSYNITKEAIAEWSGTTAPFDYLQGMLLSNNWENWAENNRITKTVLNKFSFVYTYPDESPYILDYAPIVCGNLSIDWYYGFTTSSVSTTYQRLYAAEEMFDIFRINAGYTGGYDFGHQNGYNAGYEEGYSKGLGVSAGELTGWEVIGNAFGNIFDALQVKVFGYFSLGDVIGLVVLIGIVFFVFKLVRG